ncbi:carboxylesterase 1-like [Bidens hawaiensis]|uniref:carboxylesterase 1-like n=1 Tax=Bidens hawaiensis TaxID=980011 RepID=UPI00404A6E0C
MSDEKSVAGETQPFVILNADGSYTRPVSFPSSPPKPDPDSDTPTLSKDVIINDTNKTGVRILIYIPKETPVEKLPLLVYYHGGGFIVMTAATTMNHELCELLSAHLQAVVVSVDYRNAPEHRLPAAYDDGVEALHWIKSTQDPWLTEFSDLSNCYLLGSSAGANLVYHAALRVSQHLADLEPSVIKGLILHCLFIGGVERTESEIRLASTGLLFTLSLSDSMWNLALPVGATRDREYCNLMRGSPDDMGRIKDVGCQPALQVMIIRDGDLMMDRQIEFAKALELKGVECTCFYSDGYHGVEATDKAKVEELLQEISRFMSSVNGTKSNAISDK